MTTDPGSGQVRGRRLGLATVWIVMAGVGAWTRPFSVAATVLVAGVAVVAAGCAFRAGTRTVSPGRRLRRGIVVWAVLLTAVLAWELFAWLSQPALLVPDPAHPTLSTLLGPWLDEEPGRFAGWMLWLGSGWWLVRR